MSDVEHVKWNDILSLEMEEDILRRSANMSSAVATLILMSERCILSLSEHPAVESISSKYAIRPLGNLLALQYLVSGTQVKKFDSMQPR